MANSAQAKKRARQTKVRELNNSSKRSTVRTAVKKVLKLIQTNDDAAKSTMLVATKLIDKTASQKIIHKNKAARLKSRLNKKLLALSLAAAQ